MITIVNQPPNDDFTLELFYKILKNLSCDFEAYYFWSNPPKQFAHILTNTTFTKPVVVLGIKDLLDSWKEFNFWTDAQSAGVQLLSQTAQANPATQFIVFTSLENLHIELREPNLQIMPWGGDIVNQRRAYPQVKPVLDKNFDSKKSYISLNRNNRNHRLVLLSYLFGSNLAQFGQLTFLRQNPQYSSDIQQHVDWPLNNNQQIINGYKQLYQNSELVTIDPDSIYINHNNDNANNFITRLASMYQNSFVEIVTESTFSSPGFNITEKTQHAFYGCNFPIILNGAGAVEHLRTMGFDMFDDVVDHSYDRIQNPLERIISAVESNRRLLSDVEYAKQKWIQCQTRMVNNVTTVRRIHSWYYNRLKALLKVNFGCDLL